MKRVIAFEVNGCLIVKNYAAGKRNRFDVFKPNGDRSKAKRIGCELTIGHAKQIARESK